jgi:hypothetical protein
MNLKCFVALIIWGILVTAPDVAVAENSKPVSAANIEEAFDEIALLLKVHQAFDENGPISLRRIGRDHDGGYVVPELAMQHANAVMGYGISDDISFEESAATIYHKPSFGFDGTCPPVRIQNKLCQFIPQNIIGDQLLKNYIGSIHSASFDQQIMNLGLTDQKLFVKMDIEGNEYTTMPDILRHASCITGIVLEIHFWEDSHVVSALQLMKAIDQNFVLIHVHGNNASLRYFVTKHALGNIPRVLELSYINRKLVHSYALSSDQSHPTCLDMPNAPGIPDYAFTILKL